MIVTQVRRRLKKEKKRISYHDHGLGMCCLLASLQFV
jgi:hypothetical protein